MKKHSSFRWITTLAIIGALISAAAICGRGQQQAPVQQPQAPQQQPGGQQPGQESPGGQQPGQESPGGQQSPGNDSPGGSGKVDLQFVSVEVTPGDGQGQVLVTVTLAKKGQGQITSSSTVRWYPHAKSDVVGCSWDIAALTSQMTTDCNYTYPEYGEMHWQAVLDADNDIQESNEQNNTFKGTVTISKPASGASQIKAPTQCSWKLSTIPRNIVINWNYGDASGIDGFVIYMATTDEVIRVAPGERSVMIPNLALSTQYHFDVRAYKGNVQSAVDVCSVDATTGQ